MANSLLHIDPKVLASIQDFDWAIRSMAHGEHVGQKRSKRLGTGMEFSQYRPYSQGDDLRQLDWKMYARSDKFYIKQAEVETNVDVTFVIDSSHSMLYEEAGLSKLDAAKLLCGVLGYVAIENGDLISLADETAMRSGNDSRHWTRYLSRLQHLQDTKRFETPVIENKRSKELFVFVSDLYDEGEEITSFIKTLKSSRNEVIVFHLMGDQERSLEFGNAIKFQDLETDKAVQLNPQTIKKSYQVQLSEWEKELSHDFLISGIDYNPIEFHTPVSDVINSFLHRRKQLR